MKQDATVKDPSAPKELVLRVHTDSSVQWVICRGSLRTFESKAKGYNFSCRAVNPKNGKAYMFSGNMILIGSKPKQKGVKSGKRNKK